MKKLLSSNTWAGSTWDGKSVYTKKTQEQNADGSYITITADFRKYPCVEDSIADHSAYLNGAKNGSNLRYSGLKGSTDYKKAIQIIKDGGYATDQKYVDKIVSIIERSPGLQQPLHLWRKLSGGAQRGYISVGKK